MWCSSVFKFVMFSEKWSISSWNWLDAMQYDFLKVWQIFSLERMNRFVSNFLHNDGKFLLHNRKIKWKSYFKSEFWVFFPTLDHCGTYIKKAQRLIPKEFFNFEYFITANNRDLGRWFNSLQLTSHELYVIQCFIERLPLKPTMSIVSCLNT